MGRVLLSLLAVTAATFALGASVFAQVAPELKLGFKFLADQIPATVGAPQENEHYGPNGDSLQQTSKGLLVWRKADNWTAFTNGYRTWVNGPQGLQERGNDERFAWEALPSSTPVAAPVAAPTPTPAPPTATPLPKPNVRSSLPNVIAGQGLEINNYWVLGEISNVGSAPAYNVTLNARLLSSSGSVVGTGSPQSIAYLGPGDSVGYRIEVDNVMGYDHPEVSVDASPTGFARFNKVGIGWVENAKTIDTLAGSRYEFSGNLNNAGPATVALNAIYVWFLDEQSRVVWADLTYVTDAQAPGSSYPFMIRTPWTRDNAQVGGITRVRYYAAGQVQ